MLNIDEMSIHRRQLLVGRTRQLLDAGYSTEEIREKLGLAESTVRSLVRTCKEADEKRAEMNADNNVEE